MVPVRSLKLATVALVGALGSGYALQVLNAPHANEPELTADAIGPSQARPSANESERPMGAALVATPGKDNVPVVSDAATAPDADALPEQLAALDPGESATMRTTTAAPLLRFTSQANDVSAPVATPGDVHAYVATETPEETPDAGPDVAEAVVGATDTCTPDLALGTGPGATITLRLDAPCDSGARVEIRHEALRFAERLSEDGTLQLTLPGLSASGEVAISLAGRDPVRERVALPDAALHKRLALQWTGAAEFVLHAMHGGAGLGDRGNLHHENPSSSTAIGAYTFALGDPSLDEPMLAHVHSLPATLAASVRFAITATVTATNCDTTLRAEVLGASGQPQTSPTPIALDMPDCTGSGGFVLMPVPVAQEFARR